MVDVIFTNKALRKMSEWTLSEEQVLDAFNNGVQEKWTTGNGYNSVRKYNGYEIGVAYFRDPQGKYVIT